MIPNQDIMRARRQALVEKTGAPVLLRAAFENARIKFQQDSSFYYYTGVNEPGAFCFIDIDGTTTLFVPRYTIDRSQWVPGALAVSDKTAQDYGFENVAYLGDACPGYTINPYLTETICSALRIKLLELAQKKQKLCIVSQDFVIDHLVRMVPGLDAYTDDVAPYIAAMRRKKDKEEIRALFDAIEVTTIAQEAAARAIAPGKNECQVAATIDYIFTESGARQAFPSIVGSGSNATVLHYTDNCREMQEHECVVVDIGAQLNHYCGDITRTYPVSGTFTERQKEVYIAVLEAHETAAACAKPGYWLRNNDEPAKSLHHIALEVLREKGLDKYFIHGLGHFLGLDVHDVGNMKEPLAEGDVITIEPGVYIPEESLGIRLEDNYWIIEDGAVCLSEHLPKDIASVEKMVQEEFL